RRRVRALAFVSKEAGDRREDDERRERTSTGEGVEMEGARDLRGEDTREVRRRRRRDDCVVEDRRAMDDADERGRRRDAREERLDRGAVGDVTRRDADVAPDRSEL